MSWYKRIALICAALFAIVVVAAISTYIYLRQSLPQTSGTLRLEGLSAPVEIIRDRYAVPHIYAQSWDDANFALGFVHAQDRLWQMEMNRRLTAGRLAEAFGDTVLDADKLFRTLGMRRVAQTNLAKFSSEARVTLGHYAAGVNAFLKTRGGPLPPEFLITGIDPEPWDPVDSVAWGKTMAWDLGGNWRGELARLRLSQKLSPQQISEFLAPYPGDPFIVLPDLSRLYSDVAASAQKLAELFPLQDEIGVGSNNWVVSGAHSESGKPLLANDPHLGLATPAIWYFAHLSVGGRNVIGATLPGTPLVVLGRNDRIAWGFTNTGPDVQDLFVERTDPADPRRYLAPEGWREFVYRDETIAVKGKAPVTITVRETRHGPVISDAVATAAAAAPHGHVLSFAWTALRDDDLTAQGAYKLSQAQSWNEFLAAAREYHAPQQNMVYADVDGNIGFIAPGRVPVRKRVNDLFGMAPAPGWDARYDWTGFIPFEDLPRSFNPPDGVIVTANQKIVAPDYVHFISRDWAPPYRAERIASLIASRDRHSIESFRAIQADVAAPAARGLLPILLAVKPVPGEAAEVHSRLAAWNGEMTADRAEPLIFAAWLRELTRLVYADELGADLFKTMWDQRIVFMRNVLNDVDGQSRWCDDVTTPERETCADLIRRALPIALADLKKRYGDDRSAWRWGNAHPAVSDHRPFGRVAWLGELFGVRVASPGDSFTVDVGSYTIANDAAPFASRHGPSMRAIYDLADPELSVYMHSTGQSGNILSSHYADFSRPWVRVETIPMTTARAPIEDSAIGTLRLVP